MQIYILGRGGKRYGRSRRGMEGGVSGKGEGGGEGRVVISRFL